jgi:aerobic-type carbon monoxide dehydrogenase small subunit (CoxS/CutS family)
MSLVPVEMTINGKVVRTEVLPARTLLEFLRDDLGLTGSKEGCSKGECGACTVIMDGQTVNSCLVLATQCNGSTITTIEGLGDISHLHPVQECFVLEGGVQCGFCTPGMIVSVAWLLEKSPHPTVDEIKDAISGNLCRCTGYSKIIHAAQRAAKIKEKRKLTVQV